VVKFGGSPHAASVVTLEKPLTAFGLEMDELGNYYFLGHEEDFERQSRLGELDAADFKLIHKFCSDGSFMASFFQPKATGKVSREEIARLTQCLYENGNFAALANGEMWFLYTDKKSGVQSPFEWPRFLYRINQAGEAAEVKPASPQPGYELMGVHKHDSSVLFEWVNRKKITERLLTSQDGAIQVKVDLPGKILDLRAQTVLLSTFYPKSGYKLTAWPLR
jgi:hypothetical protein